MVDAATFDVETFGATRHVVTKLRGTAPDGRGVEHDEVGEEAFGYATAVAQSVQPRRHVGELADRLFQREQPTRPHRLAEQHRRVVRVAHDVGVRARVRAAEHGAVVVPYVRAYTPCRVR